MQNFNKLSKISIIVLVLLVCGVASYFIFFGKRIDMMNPVLQNVVKKDPADDLLKNNADALKNAENTDNNLVRKIDDTDYVLGDINAPVQIIIYDDFDNEFSAGYYQTIKKVIDIYGEKIAVAFRHFPMRSHPYANISAIASECAGEQNKFWEFAERLFMAKSEAVLSEDSIDAIAQELKLDDKKFKTCLSDQKISDKMQASVDEASNLNVTGAPTTFINSIPYPGAMPFEDFEDSSGLERKGLESIMKDLIGN